MSERRLCGLCRFQNLNGQQKGTRDEGFLEVKEAEANEQHTESVIGAHRVDAPTWVFERINFVLGKHGSDVESTEILHQTKKA